MSASLSRCATPDDMAAVDSFSNFLRQAGPPPLRWVCPAVWAYVWGLTKHCPEPGTM